MCSINSIINEHGFILLSYSEGVYRSIEYYDAYQVDEEVSKLITQKESDVGARWSGCFKEYRKVENENFDKGEEEVKY